VKPSLYDTRLEPTHSALHGLPIDGSPVPRPAGSRTSGYCRHHLPCLL